MSKPYSKGIIRGANVKGVVFHTPSTVEIPKQAPGSKKTLMEEEYYQGLVKGHQQGYEAGRNEGHEIGFKEGVASLQRDLEHSVEILKNVLDAFKQKEEQLFDHAKPEIIKFCLAVCQKILRSELRDPNQFIQLLEHLLLAAKNIVKDVPVQVYVAPGDLLLLEKHFNDLPETCEEIRALDFIPDSDLERGNCRIESSLGLVNFDLERILKDIEQKTLAQSE